MAQAFNLLFFPRLQEGASQTEVITKLSATLNVERGKVAGWFESGKPTVLLKDVGADVAERYRLAIVSCGGVCNSAQRW